MRKLGTVAEFALVAGFGVMLTVRAAGSPFDQPAQSSQPTLAPSFEQIEAAVAGAEARAVQVNGRR